MSFRKAAKKLLYIRCPKTQEVPWRSPFFLFFLAKRGSLYAWKWKHYCYLSWENSTFSIPSRKLLFRKPHTISIRNQSRFCDIKNKLYGNQCQQLSFNDLLCFCRDRSSQTPIPLRCEIAKSKQCHEEIEEYFYALY